MAQRTKQRLDEVKLTLQRLQRITSESADNDDRGEEGIADFSANGSAVPGEGRLSSLGESPPREVNAQRSMMMGGVAAVMLIVGAVTVAGLGYWLLGGRGAEPARTAAVAVDAPVRPPVNPAPPNVAYIAAEAQTLIDAGKVTAGRQMLTDLARQSPEAALMLARSYDPNFLRLVSQPDATPDPKEAERWYRVWHEIAAQKGLVMEPDRLERIIKAMR